jgi:hypothetical protein
MQTVLESAQRRYPLLAIHYEREDHTTCGVGRILRTTRTTCVLDWITPEASFEGEHRRYRLADLTRVQFGNDYEEALAAVRARRDATRATHLKRT